MPQQRPKPTNRWTAHVHNSKLNPSKVVRKRFDPPILYFILYTFPIPARSSSVSSVSSVVKNLVLLFQLFSFSAFAPKSVVNNLVLLFQLFMVELSRGSGSRHLQHRQADLRACGVVQAEGAGADLRCGFAGQLQRMTLRQPPRVGGKIRHPLAAQPVHFPQRQLLRSASLLRYRCSASGNKGWPENVPRNRLLRPRPPETTG